MWIGLANESVAMSTQALAKFQEERGESVH
jgi:hypothetical protein